MKHLKTFNENFNDSDIKEINDLLIDLKELYFEFEINIPQHKSFIKVHGNLDSNEYSIKDVSNAFDDLKKRIETIYQSKIGFQLKCYDGGAEIQIDIYNSKEVEDDKVKFYRSLVGLE